MKAYTISLFLFSTSVLGCSEYLDIRPDQSLAVPSTLNDLDAIMSNETRINSLFPMAGDMAADYYYLADNDWRSLNEQTRDNYLFGQTLPVREGYWNASYVKVLDCNVVLEEVGQVALGTLTELDRVRIRGEALFVRAFAFYNLLVNYTQPYDAGSAGSTPGIPLRVTADINAPSTRESLQRSYDQLIQDLQFALEILPDRPSVKTKPGKAAAAALLSRVFLTTGDYDQALTYAEMALSLNDVLINYNTLDTVAAGQFKTLNDEVIYHAVADAANSSLGNAIARVDTVLYASYHNNDLRKKIFFKTNARGVTGFYGDYAGNMVRPVFAGIAIDELYLTRAECYARLGRIMEAQADLDLLLFTRYRTGTYNATGIPNDELLNSVLSERKKELAFRLGIRWADLKRFSKDTTHVKILNRVIDGKEYQLPETDAAFAFLIPFDVINLGGIEQNGR
ncbi:RagB/SusD family nutrient uptake outer membrane protein [Olivibacter domesticus]|uniref:SusD family protein n=1 Tax=Olivibacter domesticus TaxID=407022 RepID=A0A1H7KIG9_OLID1|nr:RagB/SusD family nutrient uptake outer membrane protein [Olivibacter domesticus]SEK86651.1 SusD family protein [Olivibacter domesticus]